MKQLRKLFLSGLMAVIPLSLTIYALVWIATTVEKKSTELLSIFVPKDLLVPGLGFVAGVMLLMGVGLLLRAWLFRRLFEYGETLLARLPLVKSLYSSLRDLTQFLSQPKGKEMGQVVQVELSTGVMAIGFITCENLPAVNARLPHDKIAVYLPLSYQIGGHLLLVPRSAVHPLDMQMNEAMRFVITGGMTAKSPEAEKKNELN